MFRTACVRERRAILSARHHVDMPTVARTALVPSPIALIRTALATNKPGLFAAHRRGQLTRVLPGVYANTAAWRELTPWERYLAKVHAVSAQHPEFVICGPSAAALHGVGLARSNDPVHVLDPYGTSRVVGAVKTVVSLDVRHVERVDGILLASIGDTIVDVVRASTPGVGLAYADALLRRDPDLTIAQLQAINEARISSRFRRRARWVLDRATGIPESVLESLSLAVMEFAGFELPELQTIFRSEGVEDHADFFWRRLDLIGEADGEVKYSGSLGAPGDVIRAEKRRESRLRRQVSAHLRWGWPEIKEPDLLTTMLQRARVPRIGPPDPVMLASLRQALR